MAEWHLPPDYIVSHWTDELFGLMAKALVSRKERLNRTMGSKATSRDRATVSVEELANMTDMIKVVRK